MSQQVTMFLQFDQCVLVKQKRVLVSDVASIYGTDTTMRQKVGALELYRFPKEQKEKQVFSFQPQADIKYVKLQMKNDSSYIRLSEVIIYATK